MYSYTGLTFIIITTKNKIDLEVLDQNFPKNFPQYKYLTKFIASTRDNRQSNNIIVKPLCSAQNLRQTKQSTTTQPKPCRLRIRATISIPLSLS